MIPIEIDNENIAFRDLHFDKVNEEIRILLILKRDSYEINSFEYKTLDWINTRFKDILIGNLLRNIIQEFNDFIETFVTTVRLTISNDDKTITVERLKQICRENSIQGFSNKNKNDLVTLVNSNTNLTGQTIDNLKYMSLLNKINPILKNVFEDFYEKEWDEIEEYDRYIFVTKHNLKTCPYCNMGYILISKRDEKKKNGLRPEIDHFFPKSIYPYLAMSFYNLIPSCKVCNHTKGSKDTYIDGLLSPYEMEDNTFQLTYRLRNINFRQVKKQKYNVNESFEIEFKKIDKHSNKYFKLDKLYEQHKDIVLELLIKKAYYPQSYIEELSAFGFSQDEIYRYLFSNYSEDKDLHKRPLSKLIKDISTELGIV